MLPCGHLVNYDSEGPDVARERVLLVREALGRHVAERSRVCFRALSIADLLLSQPLADAEIC